MSRKLISILNLVIAGFTAFIFLLSFGYAWSQPSDIPVSEAQSKQRTLPENPFTQNKASYDKISDTLQLSFGTPPLQLPNLKNSLVYYGPSDRPDVPKDSTLLHFATATGKGQATVPPSQKLYLMFNRNLSPAQYVFSPNNKETPIWIEGEAKDKEVFVKVSMRNENGDIVRSPDQNADFTLLEREYTRPPGTPAWEIGKWRVDGTLLARQRARWFGEDRFLERHGGEEFAEFANTQRIDFGENGDTYSIYVALGDTLVWDKDRWIKVTPGKETQNRPIMQVKRVDDRIMSFELWDDDGMTKLALNLLRSKEPWSPQQIEQDFKFVATRTRSQYIFEVKDEKMILRPQDWLILTEKGWEKIDTEKEVDDYVDRKLVGPLFVFEGVVKKDDRQVLVGTLFNATRTEYQTIELPAQQSNVTVIKMPKEDLKVTEPFGNGNRIEQNTDE